MEKQVTEIFGSYVFSDKVMKEKLPRETYKKVKEAVTEAKSLDLDVANVIATAMKDWAIDLGATHFTHWFQPMTNITAEKHDSFIQPVGDGTIIMEFSGKELIKGEPDASSFPSGGIRATFEARGYTAWDPSSPAFVKDSTLYIPTAFCSYTGEALDKKTPLLRSMDALNIQAKRILALFGDTSVKRVTSTVGPEQEYFLIDAEMFAQRKDLVYTGRTLFGAQPPKGQELEDHYFGTLKPKISAFMDDLNQELWKLGILAKTQHNEVAPAQHELAPIFSETNIAVDHNYLTMELMKKVAQRHGFACLLHEKPFAGINGSGKHNNWSLATDAGENLLDPGNTPIENAKFLLFLVAVIKGVDDYADLLRMSVASAGNDHRLGANEAPPAVISIFLGEELTGILEALESGSAYDKTFNRIMALGANVLPHLSKDTTDRNRTSPFAFTGNKFEFRMVGSSMSISGPNITLNTILAESLKLFADRLEKVSAEEFESEVGRLIKEEIIAHKRIIFNGDNYTEEWLAEAAKRGLPNLNSTPKALAVYIAEKNVELFERHNVFTKTEVHSRYEIKMESYVKTLRIEALSAVEMVNKQILPAVSSYKAALADTISSVEAADPNADLTYEKETLASISKLSAELFAAVKELATENGKVTEFATCEEQAEFVRESIFNKLNSIRVIADCLEVIVEEDYWPFPTYGKLLYSIT